MNRLTNFNPEFITKKIFPHVDRSVINLGQCFIWAYSAFLIFDKVKLCSVDCHAFVKYKGYYYDADCPRGSKDWNNLPATSFTDFNHHSYDDIEGFKKAWDTQPERFQTNWKQIERRAFNVLKRFSHEKS